MKKFLKIILYTLLIVGGSLAITIFVSEKSFENQTNEEVVAMFKKVANTPLSILTEEDIKELPEPVKRWLRYSDVIGKEKVTSVRLKQKGFFKKSMNEDWMPFEAVGYYTVDEPSFVWFARIEMFPFFNISGRDKYEKGSGNMLIKLASVVNLVDAKGYEISQGSLLRYLNEIMWFPSAAVSGPIFWTAINKNSAKATMIYGDVSASAIFYFNDKGQIVNMTANRYASLGENFSLEKWSTPIDGYSNVSGHLIPYKGTGVWNLRSGAFPYIKLEVTEIEYNNPTPY